MAALSTTALVFNFLRGRDNVTPHLRRIANQAAAANRQLRFEGRLTTVIWGAVASAIGGAIAQVVALTNALAPMAGALGALPAIAFATAAGLGAIVLGFKNLGGALKTASGGGRSLSTVATAERRLEQAQKQALRAQQAINDARAEAARRLADITRELAHARLDEEAAVLGVAEAQIRLREARTSGDRIERAQADLGYRQAVQTLDDVRARLAEVTVEERKRRDAGVEGSEEVKDAVERHKEALDNIKDAQDALKRAQTGGGGGVDKAAEAYAKLAPEAKRVVDVLRQIGPAWRGVQRAVQAAVFKGVAKDIAALSSTYLPVMRAQLPAIGQGWNNLFRGMLQVSTTPGFVADINTALGQSAAMWQRVGRAFGPFLDAFRQWIAVGASFLPRLGGWVLDIANRFDAWSKKVRETGQAHQWIERALQVGHQFNQLLGAMFSATAKIFQLGGDPTLLTDLVAGAQAFRDWLDTAEGQERVTHLFSEFRDIGSAVWEVIKTVLDVLSQADLSGVVGAFGMLNAVFAFLGQNMGVVNAILPVLIPAFTIYKTHVTAIRVALGLKAGVTRIAAFYTKDLGKAIGAVGKLMKTTTVRALALRAALLVGKAVTLASAAAQWVLNVAMSANPITLIIIAIVALVAAFVILWNKSAAFRNFWIGLWNIIKAAALAVGRWFRDTLWNKWIKGAWNGIKDAGIKVWNWLKELPGKLFSKFKSITRSIASPFVGAFNFVARAWNDTVGQLEWTIPSWVPFGLGGKTIHAPRLPYVAFKLAEGGLVRARPGGVPAMLAERGEDELVTPLSKLPDLVRGVGRESAQRVVVEFEFRGAEDDVVRMFRKAIRARGGNVQVALGRG